jgi:hypothetical protein
MPTSRPLPVLRADRLRRVPRSFAWIDHRVRSWGLLERLSPAEVGLYLYLVLAADRQGLSCWRLERIERQMPCFDLAALHAARKGLISAELVAFRAWSRGSSDGVYQVLSMPARAAEARRRGGIVSIGEALSEFLKEER